MSSPRRAIQSLYFTTAALASGYGVMFALLEKIHEGYGISKTMLGFIVGMGFFSSFLAQIFLAPYADRGHARILLLGGLGANIIGLVCLAIATEAPLFLVGRALMGFGVGACNPAIRRSISAADPDNVGKNLGGQLSYDVAGFLIGPIIAALLVGPLGLHWPFIAGLLGSVACLPLIWNAPIGPPDPRAFDQPRLAVGLLKHRWMQATSCYGVAFFVMIAIFDVLWAIRIKDLHGPYVFVTLGIVAFAAPMVLLGGKGGAFAERTGPFRTGALGLVVGSICIALYGVVPFPLMMLMIGVVHATNDAFTASSVPVGISLTAPPEQLAAAQGLVGAVQTLTGGIASLSAGAVYDRLGPVATYVGGGTLMLLIVGLGWLRAGQFQSVRKLPAAA